MSAVVGVAVALAIGMRCAGLLIPYRVPTGGMQPSIQNGDCVLMEGITYQLSSPTRGDLLVFRTRGIQFLQNDEVYVQRVVGLPGERLRLENGKLHVNGNAVLLTGEGNKEPIRYLNVGHYLARAKDEFLVPPGTFFVLGDNTAHSLDSRYWGPVPRANIKGRVWFRYWPIR